MSVFTFSLCGRFFFANIAHDLALCRCIFVRIYIGKRHGRGEYGYNDGSKYIGTWDNDRINGEGTSWYPNGNKYTGEWTNGKINGKGTIYLASGDKYIGDWKDGRRHGNGSYFYHDGDRYDGEWRNDERVSRAVLRTECMIEQNR